MPPGAAHFLEMIRQVRGETLRLLAAAPRDGLTWAPPGTSNHILWHAGHALWVADLLCIEPIAGRSELPPGWEAKFGSECQPVARTRQWPSRGEVQQLLTAQQLRMEQLLSTLSPEQLNDSRPVIDTRGLVSSIVHGLHDEAKHQGEIFLLLKLLRAR